MSHPKGDNNLTKLALNDRLRKKLYDLLYNNIDFGKVLDVDFTTGLGYSDLSITSSSAIGLVKGHDGLWGAKPAGYLAGLEGARVNGSAPAWDDGSGNALSGVRWTGPKAATTTLNVRSKPTPGLNDWALVGSITDGGNVPGPDGNATSARRFTFSGYDQYVVRSGMAATASPIYGTFIIKGTAGNKINAFVHHASGNYNWQITLNGDWLNLSELGSFSSSPGFTNIALHTNNSTDYGKTGVTPSQEIDVFLIQASTAPDAYIPTTGTNLTRLAETVEFPYTIGTEFTAIMDVDFTGFTFPPAVNARVFGSSSSTHSLLYMGAANPSVLVAKIDSGDYFGSPNASHTGGAVRLSARVGGGLWTGRANSSQSGNASFSATTWPSSIQIGTGSGTANLSANIQKVKMWSRRLSYQEVANV